MISTSLDILEGSPCGCDVLFLRLAQQGPQVIDILRPAPVVARQHLERHEVADQSNRDDESGKDFQPFGSTGNIALDAGRREKKIDHDASLRTLGRNHAHRRESVDRQLLQGDEHAKALGLQRKDQRFGIGVVRDANDYVDVARGARLGAGADRQTSDESPLSPRCRELTRDAPKRSFERAHPRRGQGTGRPTASPFSAPGRCWRQWATRLSISSSLSVGWARTSFWRIIASPSSASSSAIRTRWATRVTPTDSF